MSKNRTALATAKVLVASGNHPKKEDIRQVRREEKWGSHYDCYLWRVFNLLIPILFCPSSSSSSSYYYYYYYYITTTTTATTVVECLSKRLGQ